MTLEEIRKKNAERKQMMEEKIKTLFVKMVNDQDTIGFKMVPPFDGFYRKVQTYDKTYKEKLHYRGHIIGDFNGVTKQPLSKPKLEYTADEIRKLTNAEARIWTTPFTAAQGIQREIDKGHSIFMITRNGDPKTTTTNYSVLYAAQMTDEDWECLLPNISRPELEKLQAEEKWDEISDEELHRLETLGVKENEQ